MEISKYRVKLDAVKKELVVNEKQLRETQTKLDEAEERLKKLQSVGKIIRFMMILF